MLQGLRELEALLVGLASASTRSQQQLGRIVQLQKQLFSFSVEALCALGEPELAENLINERLQFARRILKNQASDVLMLIELAKQYRRTERWQKARELLAEALQVAQKLQAPALQSLIPPELELLRRLEQAKLEA